MAAAVPEDPAASPALTKTFDSKTTADLERVTDYEEDKEISSVNINNVSNAIALERKDMTCNCSKYC